MLFLLLIHTRGTWSFLHSYLTNRMSKIQEEGDSFSQMSPHVSTLQVYMYFIYIFFIYMRTYMHVLAAPKQHENKLTFYATDLLH